MSNNLSVKITADVTDLQVKFAVAKAEVQGLTSEMNKLARSSAAGTIDAAGTARMQQLSSDLLQARTQAQGYAGAMEKAGFSLTTFGRAASSAGEHSATGVRYVRELFDEISSGRTRYLPSTLAAFSQTVLHMSMASLGAVGAVAALAGGLLYLSYRAEEASSALDAMHIDSLRAGNDATRASLQQLTDQLTQLPGVGQSAATTLVTALSAVRMPFVALQASARLAAEQMAQTGDSADQVGKQIARSLSPDTSATEVAKQLQGDLTQAQVNAAEAVDKSGNANAILAEKLQLLSAPLDRARSSVNEYHRSWLQAEVLDQIKVMQQYATQLNSGAQLQSIETTAIQNNSTAWRTNATAIKQAQTELSTQPARPSLEFDKGSSDNAGMREYLENLKQIGEEHQREAEKEIEEANQTLDALVEAAKQASAQTQAIARQDADTTVQLSRMKLQAEKDVLDQSVTATQAAADRKYARLKELTNQEFQLDLQQLQNELSSLKDQPVEYDRVYNQIRELKQRNILDLAQLDKQATQAVAQETKQQSELWKGTVNEIESAEQGFVSNLLSKRKSLSQSLIELSGQLVEKEIADDLRAVTTRLLLHQTAAATTKALEQGGYAYHLAMELAKTGTTTAQQTAQTAATVTGSTARQAAQTTAAAASKATQAATGVSTVMSDAAMAFAGTFASVSAIPGIGWSLAPGLASAAYAQVAAMAPEASLAVGAWEVPHDMVAQIHRGESVVPTTFAAGMRQNGGFGAGQGSNTENHYHFGSSMDAKSFDRYINQPAQRQSIAKALRNHVGR